MASNMYKAFWRNLLFHLRIDILIQYASYFTESIFQENANVAEVLFHFVSHFETLTQNSV